ncbi:SMARCD2 [Cordylochernes scorpioides]|uniref:SMARCD2 n=1 Tax=Cordylochernes scorpioides TaxID=51811 RepID=A0ABY6L6C0_9ARAC|nr:SMARCD2 [Cordylochernes scorpioides]
MKITLGTGKVPTPHTPGYTSHPAHTPNIRQEKIRCHKEGFLKQAEVDIGDVASTTEVCRVKCEVKKKRACRGRRDLPPRLQDTVPELKGYLDLVAFENKLDFTIMRKRMSIQEVLKKPLKGLNSQYWCHLQQRRKLRIFISNTFFPGKIPTNENEEPVVPSWELRVEGRLLDDVSPPFQAGVVQHATGKLDKGKRKFSSFFKSLVIELDKNYYGPDNHLVERCVWLQWHRTPATTETDGFQVKRPGDKSVKCTILLLLDYQVTLPGTLWYMPWYIMVHALVYCGTCLGISWYMPWYIVVHALVYRGTPLGISWYMPWYTVVHALVYRGTCLGISWYMPWYILVHALVYPELAGQGRCEMLSSGLLQPLQYKLDSRLARLLGIHTQTKPVIIASLWQYIKTHKLQDSTEKEYINCDKCLEQVLLSLSIFKCHRFKFSEIPQRISQLLLPADPVVINHVIKWDDPIKSMMTQFLQNTTSQSDIQALDQKIQETVNLICDLKDSMDFYQDFADNTQDFIDHLIVSQTRDYQFPIVENLCGDCAVCVEQTMVEVSNNPEDERRSSYFYNSWAQEAVCRYFYSKVQQRRTELEQALGIRNS